MSEIAVAIIVVGFFICWEIRDLAKAILKNKEERNETDTD